MLDFDNGATSKIDDVLSEHGGLLHVLPLTVHLNIFLTDMQGGTFCVTRLASLELITEFRELEGSSQDVGREEIKHAGGKIHVF